MIRREVHLYNLHPFDDCYIAQTLEDMYISKALGELDLFDEATLLNLLSWRERENNVRNLCLINDTNCA